MKKGLLVFMALSCVAASTFAADLKVTGWGRGIFSPIASMEDSKDTKDSTLGTSLSCSWGGAPRVGISVIGTSDNAGFQIDLKADASFGESPTYNFGINDEAKIWLKPISFAKLQVGKIHEDSLRGDMPAYGAWNWLRIGSLDQEEAIFGRTDITEGATVNLTPVEGLILLGGFEVNNGGDSFSYTDANDNGVYDVGETITNAGANQTAEETYKYGQYGAGYTIANVGQFRAQFLGGESNNWVNGAFRFTAIQNLYADIGCFAGLDGENDVMIRGYVRYTMDKANIHLLGRYDMYKETGANDVMTVGAGFDIPVAEKVTFELDARAETVSAKDDAIGFGGLIGISKGFSNGKIGIGVEATNKIALAGISRGSDEDLSWAVPITFEYSF